MICMLTVNFSSTICWTTRLSLWHEPASSCASPWLPFVAATTSTARVVGDFAAYTAVLLVFSISTSLNSWANLSSRSYTKMFWFAIEMNFCDMCCKILHSWRNTDCGSQEGESRGSTGWGWLMLKPGLVVQQTKMFNKCNKFFDITTNVCIFLHTKGKKHYNELVKWNLQFRKILFL